MISNNLLFDINKIGRYSTELYRLYQFGLLTCAKRKQWLFKKQIKSSGSIYHLFDIEQTILAFTILDYIILPETQIFCNSNNDVLFLFWHCFIFMFDKVISNSSIESLYVFEHIYLWTQSFILAHIKFDKQRCFC